MQVPHAKISPEYLAAVQAAAIKLAAIADGRMARATYLGEAADYATRAYNLRHIAADAASAADPESPCGASLESVAEWLARDEELALAADKEMSA